LGRNNNKKDSHVIIMAKPFLLFLFVAACESLVASDWMDYCYLSPGRDIVDVGYLSPGWDIVDDGYVSPGRDIVDGGYLSPGWDIVDGGYLSPGWDIVDGGYLSPRREVVDGGNLTTSHPSRSPLTLPSNSPSSFNTPLSYTTSVRDIGSQVVCYSIAKKGRFVGRRYCLLRADKRIGLCSVTGVYLISPPLVTGHRLWRPKLWTFPVCGCTSSRARIVERVPVCSNR
jgi:hypothetical protein